MFAKINKAEIGEREFYLPKDLQILSQNEEAFRAVESSRWPVSKYCPRCKSLYTKPVNTSVFRELHRCIDCGYMFNTFSGTIFQGAKLPVVKFFQLFVIYDAIGKDISPRDVSYAIAVSHKTAVALIARMKGFAAAEPFTMMDREAWDVLKARSKGFGSDHKHESFFQYCDMKNIVINMDLFKNYLALVLSAESNSKEA
jgi:transposase-like protein